MKLWIVKFVPYEGPLIIEGYFRDEGRANVIFQKKISDGLQTFVDDFGVKIKVDRSRCAVVFTNSESSAAFTAAVTTANADAASVYGYATKLDPGSTIQ